MCKSGVSNYPVVLVKNDNWDNWYIRTLIDTCFLYFYSKDPFLKTQFPSLAVIFIFCFRKIVNHPELITLLTLRLRHFYCYFISLAQGWINIHAMPGSLNQSKTLISGRFDVEGNEKHLNEKLTCNSRSANIKIYKKIKLRYYL